MFNRRYPRIAVSFLAGLLLIPAATDVCSAQKRFPGDLPNRVLVLDGSPVHNVGNLRVHASNWGAIGSMPGAGQPFSNAPSAEWPAGSRVEYLFIAGLWVGGLINGVPSVTTAAFNTEFRPSSSPLDVVYYSAFGASGGNRIPSANADDDNDGTLDEDFLDGFDNDLDGLVDEDFAGISDQMLARRFRDDDPSVFPIYPNHAPLHLAIVEESYQFSHADFDDFVGFTVKITNDGINTIEDVFVGLFADGDVGHRDIPDYWEDDATAFENDIVVDHGVHGTQAYDFTYWYDVDGDGGQAAGYCGIVMLDHQAATYANFSGSASYEDGGDPTNDFERYELMSSQTIERDPTVPRDHRALVAIGPFETIAPGQTIEVNFALVVTPRDDFTNVERAATAYHGLWFDLDDNPATGVDGKEHQEHWYLPNDNPLPIAITNFDARVVDTRAVRIAWKTVADEAIEGFELLRATAGATLRSIMPGLLSPNTHEFVDVNVTPGERYEYVLVAHAVSGTTFQSQRAGVSVPNVAMSLRQNAPNPFAESTTIGIALPERSDVEVSIFDVSGKLVATITRGEREGGEHAFLWDGRDDAGRRVGAGVYFYRLKSGGETLTRKLVLMR